jgi:hypothetical protein
MAKLYADSYGLLAFAGSDNHNVKARTLFGGMSSDVTISDEQDFIAKVKNGEMETFSLNISPEAEK